MPARRIAYDPSTASVSYNTDNTDCDDTRNDVHPAADEVCDLDDVDEDCVANDLDSDMTSTELYYVDAIRMDTAKRVREHRIAMIYDERKLVVSEHRL